MTPRHKPTVASRPAPNPFDEVEATVMSTTRAGDLIGEGYRLERMIGEGGMGTVWEAWDPGLDRPVAVKLLSPSFCSDADVVQRFEREGRALARLDHPHIVPIYTVGRHGSQPYLVMKLLEGEPLHERRVKSGGRLAPEALRPILRQVCDALQHLHDAGFVHRDLKPMNVFLTDGGDAYLLDLGLVREQRSSSTRTGMLMGTPAYMSPEQTTAVKKVDYRSDLYSLGVVVFEMLCGVPPFEGTSDHEVMRAHVQRAAPSLSSRAGGLPAALERVVQRALEKDPARRHASARDLFEDFERALDDEPSVSTVVEMPLLVDASDATTRRDGMKALGSEVATQAEVRPVKRRTRTPVPAPIEESEELNSALVASLRPRRNAGKILVVLLSALAAAASLTALLWDRF